MLQTNSVRLFRGASNTFADTFNPLHPLVELALDVVIETNVTNSGSYRMRSLAANKLVVPVTAACDRFTHVAMAVAGVGAAAVERGAVVVYFALALPVVLVPV